MSTILTLSITAVLLIFCVGEWLPLDFVAILTAGMLMLLGLVTPEEGISGFGNSATITVMAMFILSAGIARTGAIGVVNNFFLKWGGKHPTRQILTLGAIVGPITALINNTAVVAVFLPIIEDWCARQKVSVSKVLIPLSYIAILGGMITVIGTSTNVLASGLSEQLGYGAFNLFQFTQLGIITFIIGLIYLAVAAPSLLPARRQPNHDLIEQDYQLKHYLSEIVIPGHSTLVGQTLGESCLKRSANCPYQRFDVDVLELIRYGVHFSHPLDHKVLQPEDILLVRASREDLIAIKEEKGIFIHPERQFDPINLDSDGEGLAEALISSNSEMIGSTLKEIRFRQRYNATVLAIRHGEELNRERLGDIPLRFGDVLLIQGPKPSLAGLQANRNMVIINQQELGIVRREKGWIAIAIVLAVVGLAALNLVPILVSSLIGAILMVITGCLKPGELYSAVRWDIIFLLAGLIPLGIAMEKSGATHWIAEQLASVGMNLSGYWVLTLFFVVTSVMTEILSNSAAVVLLIPIAAEVAMSLDLNPLALIFAVTFAASNSFLTPIGYQTNTIVYSPGGYKFTDFMRVGLPLNILMAIVIPPLIIHFYGL
ncbi:MAG: SLC13 family permease [Xenococcaceae cyanobacterium]